MQFKWLYLILFALTGCAEYTAFGDCAHRVHTSECTSAQRQQRDADLVATSYAAADELLQYHTNNVQPNKCLLVTTIADINNLHNSTPLGRLIGEQLSVRFTQKGYFVREVKLQDPLALISAEGEFALARDVQTICTNGQGNVVTGTYAVGENIVFITLKLLSFRDSQVLAAHAYSLPLGENTMRLLKEPSWW